MDYDPIEYAKTLMDRFKPASYFVEMLNGTVAAESPHGGLNHVQWLYAAYATCLLIVDDDTRMEMINVVVAAWKRRNDSRPFNREITARCMADFIERYNRHERPNFPTLLELEPEIVEWQCWCKELYK